MIFIVSIIAGVLGFYLSYQMSQKANKGPIQVVVAHKDMAVGETLSAEDLKLMPAPRGTNLDESFKSRQAIVGRTVRQLIRRGQVISTFDLLRDSDGLAGLIPPGYRAAPINLQLSKEILNLLKFGARVDVLFVDGADKTFKTRTIMKNILVMKAEAQTSSKVGTSGANVAVTLAIKPQAVEMFSYAANKGRLSVSIRPYEETNAPEEYVSLDELMGVDRRVINIIGTPKPEIEVIRGIKKETVKI